MGVSNSRTSTDCHSALEITQEIMIMNEFLVLFYLVFGILMVVVTTEVRARQKHSKTFWEAISSPPPQYVWRRYLLIGLLVLFFWLSGVA